MSEYLCQKSFKTEATSPRKRSIGHLVPATGGYGLQPKIDPEEQRLIEEENLNYSSHSKRARTYEQNFEYVEANRASENQIVSKLNQENLVKTEPELPDSTLIEYYNTPSFNFFNHKYNSNLPILQHREEIVQNLQKCNIMIIQGNTGCGKTTQVPQFIIDDAAQSSRRCKMLITQPRRIAAKSISKRVCDERGWKWGSVCGYKVSLENKFSEETSIFYVTTGYLLEMIVANHAELQNYTHILLDEIHDRDLDTDLVILLIKLLLMKQFTGKVVMMSATLDPEIFIQYFSPYAIKNHIPVIQCQINVFDVVTKHLDDIEDMVHFETGIEFKFDNPMVFDEQFGVMSRLLRYIDSKEVAVQTLDTINGLATIRGAALIFLPGWHEIERAEKYLVENLSDNNLVICRLHSDISLETQMQAFDDTAPYYRKIILSTSIAESSLTVPDIKYIIDFCLTKVPYTDPTTNYTSLQLAWASKSNMRQRRGRAGRVSQGIYFRLIPARFYMEAISDHPEPAITRESIDKLILNIKRVCSDKPKKILGLALTPPTLDQIERTVIYLKQVGALSLYKKQLICPDDGDLTYAGSIMVSLPIDLRLTKLILYGHVFDRLRDAVVLAAALSAKSIFTLRPGSQFEFYKGKYYFSSGQMSDFACILNAYNLWKAHKRFSRMSGKEMEKWCHDHNLDLKNLNEAEKIRQEIEKRLSERHGLKVHEQTKDIRELAFGKQNVMDPQAAIDEYYILNFMIAGAFYPNYFKTGVSDEVEIVKMLNGKDAKTTIAVASFPDSAIVYHKKIQEIFGLCSSNLVIHYEEKKAFIEFKESFELVNKIANGVYLSLVLNRLDRPIELSRVFAKDYQRVRRDLDFLRKLKAKEYGIGYTSRMTTTNQSMDDDVSLLVKDMNEFRIKPVVLNQLTHFWAHIDEEQHQVQLNRIEEFLANSSYKFKLCRKENLAVGKLVVCFHFTGNGTECGFYRARINKINNLGCHIIYVDYGNSEEKDFSLIYECPQELIKIPSQAIRCELAHLRLDSLILSDKVKSEKALDEYSTILYSVQNLKARIYSIVENTVRVTLLDSDNPLFEYDLASKLIKIGIFDKCDEPYASKLKHEERINTRFYEGVECSKSSKEWVHIENIENNISSLRFDKNEKFVFKIRSPIETRLYTMTKEPHHVSARPDRLSINRILLDQDHTLKCSNLLVAHQISDNGRDIVLRETCLLPKIKGLVSLVLLAFSPEVEFRYDPRTLTYTGALCGLGFDTETRRPIYTENDIEDYFEVDFYDRDIALLNSFRSIVNQLLVGGKNSKKFTGDDDAKKVKNLQKNSRTSILALLSEKRTLKEPQFFDRRFRWKQMNEKHLKILSDTDKIILKSREKNLTFLMPLRAVDFAKIKQEKCY